MSHNTYKRAGDGSVWSTGTGSAFVNRYAFAALDADGAVVTWGRAEFGGDSGTVADQLGAGVQSVHSNAVAFAAVTEDGALVTWGDPQGGGNSDAVRDALDGTIRSVQSTQEAFSALRDDGSLLSWGRESAGGGFAAENVAQVFSNAFAFAAIRTDGSVLAWGDAVSGGDTGAVAAQLEADVLAIFQTRTAFAALKSGGSVVAWGNTAAGGDAPLADLGSDVQTIASTASAFAALKSDGSVVAWGDPTAGGAPGSAAEALAGGVVALHANGSAFAALKADGSVVTWGHGPSGGDSTAVAEDLDADVVALHSTEGAFAALRADGSVVTWGAAGSGGDAEAVAEDLAGGVAALFATRTAFAALTEDGAVVTWGNPGRGGDSSTVAEALAGGVVGIHASERAFAALKSDGSVVTWGQADWGGDSSAVAEDLAAGITGLATPFPLAAPSIDVVAGDDRIDRFEVLETVQVTGQADAHARLTVTLGEAVQHVTADATGRWQAEFAPETLPGYGAQAVSVAAQALGGGTLDATRDIRVIAIPEDVPFGLPSDTRGPGVGSIWGMGTGGSYAHRSAFATINADGGVVTWGNQMPAAFGYLPWDQELRPNGIKALDRLGIAYEFAEVAPALESGVISITSTTAAFAALREDGSVVTWGHPVHGGAPAIIGYDPGERGGDPDDIFGMARVRQTPVTEDLDEGVVAVYATRYAFAALKADGSVVTWGGEEMGGKQAVVFDYPNSYRYWFGDGDDDVDVSEHLRDGVVSITSAAAAFAALKADGSVVTWGAGWDGGDSSYVSAQLSEGVVAIYSALASFVALKEDGSVVVWGELGGRLERLPAGQRALLDAGVAKVVPSPEAFFLITNEGAVVQLGYLWGSGDERANQLTSGVVDIVASSEAFAALMEDGSVFTWGYNIFGADSSAVAHALRAGVVEIFSTEGAFAALKADGSVVTWGRGDWGGNSGAVADRLSEGVVTIASNGRAFAALKDDGSVVTWGAAGSGGDSGAVAEELSGSVLRLHATGGAFAAIKADGSVVTWGSPNHGGVQGDAAGQLSEGIVAFAAPWRTEPIPAADLVARPEIFITDPADDSVVIGVAEQLAGLVIRGSADPGAVIRVTFAGESQQTTADAQGQWALALEPGQVPDFGSYSLSARALRDGLVGVTHERAVEVTNVRATIDGAASGSVIEDTPGAETATGLLNVTDPDAGENRFQEVPRTDLRGAFGRFAFDAETGAWSFQLDNLAPEVLALEEGAVLSDSLPVRSLDGTATETITVTIAGTGARTPDPDAVVQLHGFVADRADRPVGGVEFVLTAADGTPQGVTSSAQGTFSLELAYGLAGRLDATRPHDPLSDPAITVADALEVLRMAVGLAPSWGVARAFDYIAADINRDGAVTAEDALEVLRAAVGLESTNQPRWIYLDSRLDLDAISRTDTGIETGVAVDTRTAGWIEAPMTAILLGSLQELA